MIINILYIHIRARSNICYYISLSKFVFYFLQNKERLDSEIIYDRDFDFDYFGFKVPYFRKYA